MVSTAVPHVRAATATADDHVPVKKSESSALSFYYGSFQALKNISMPIYEKKVTALIGPSGCGKSTYLRCFNRMHDLYPGNRYEGQIMLYPDDTRSEEHTSELQSRLHLVCRLLLEKKKKNKK